MHPIHSEKLSRRTLEELLRLKLSRHALPKTPRFCGIFGTKRLMQSWSRAEKQSPDSIFCNRVFAAPLLGCVTTKRSENIESAHRAMLPRLQLSRHTFCPTHPRFAMFYAQHGSCKVGVGLNMNNLPTPTLFEPAPNFLFDPFSGWPARPRPRTHVENWPRVILKVRVS